MKKALLLASAFIISFFTYSQSFILSSSGLLNAGDTSKHFVVIKVDSVSAKDLYARSYFYIEHNWKNPDFANSGKVEGEFLHINTYAKNVCSSKAGLGMKNPIDIKYSLNLDFKDGKIKYEIIDLEMTGHSSNGTPFIYYLVSPGGMVWAMYGKDGEIKGSQESAREQLETYFNTQLADYVKAVSSAAKKEDF
jgi:hypothetical protein